MSSDNFDEDNKSQITRRNLLKVLSGVFTGFIVLTLGFPMVENLVGTITKKKKKIYSEVTSIGSIPVNTPVTYSFVITEEDAFIKTIKPHDVWTVKKSGDEITVYSPICPHLGCRYQWHPERKLFICPCHHSMFDINGKVVSGPAPRPLDTLPKKIENNHLYVLWERFKPGIAEKEVI